MSLNEAQQLYQQAKARMIAAEKRMSEIAARRQEIEEASLDTSIAEAKTNADHIARLWATGAAPQADVTAARQRIRDLEAQQSDLDAMLAVLAEENSLAAAELEQARKARFTADRELWWAIGEAEIEGIKSTAGLQLRRAHAAFNRGTFGTFGNGPSYSDFATKLKGAIPHDDNEIVAILQKEFF